MHTWLLPEYIEEILPAEARRIEERYSDEDLERLVRAKGLAGETA